MSGKEHGDGSSQSPQASTHYDHLNACVSGTLPRFYGLPYTQAALFISLHWLLGQGHVPKHGHGSFLAQGNLFCVDLQKKMDINDELAHEYLTAGYIFRDA